MYAPLGWAIAGLALVIAEVLTGTFYLLMLGLAAFGAALAAYMGQAFSVQVVVAAIVAAAGCYGVHAYRVRNRAQQMPNIDAGMPATFEQWIDEPARRARVHYRGASWEAEVDGGGALQPGAVLYVVNSHGNTLKV